MNDTWHWVVQTSEGRIYYASTRQEAKDGLREGEFITGLEKETFHTPGV